MSNVHNIQRKGPWEQITCPNGSRATKLRKILGVLDEVTTSTRKQHDRFKLVKNNLEDMSHEMTNDLMDVFQEERKDYVVSLKKQFKYHSKVLKELKIKIDSIENKIVQGESVKEQINGFTMI